MIRCAVLAVLVLVATPVWAQHAVVDATPPDSQIEKLRTDQSVFGWLRVTTDSTRLELRARVIDDQGLSGFKFRRSASAPRVSIPWSSISRIDAGGSRLHNAGFGAVAGAIILGGVAGAAAATTQEADSWDQVVAGLTGGLVGGVIGIGVGGLVGALWPPWHKVYEPPHH
jgi:hypothetical protein